MNQEAYRLRKQINDLKKRLTEVESDRLSVDEEVDLCTSSVCAHDEIISNLRKMCRTYDFPNRVVVAAWEHKPESPRPRWFSQTAYAGALPYLIRNPSGIMAFLTPLTLPGAVEVLWFLFEQERSESEATISRALPDTGDVRAVLETLSERGHIETSADGAYGLTMKGWETFIIIAQLTYTLDIKVDVAKAQRIAEALKDVFDIDWGEYLGRPFEAVRSELAEAGWLEKLIHAGITDEDLERVVHEHNAPRNIADGK